MTTIDGEDVALIREFVSFGFPHVINVSFSFSIEFRTFAHHIWNYCSEIILLC